MIESQREPEAFSSAEYERRWSAVLDRLPSYEVDAVAVTAPLHVRYLAGCEGDGMWVCPLILTPDHPPTFIVRRYDEDSIGLESRAPRVVSYFGEDDAVAVWAETLREMGLERARLGLELDCWGIAPRDVAELQQLLPNLTVVDASRLVGEVMDIKSTAEITVMRRAMELTKVGLAAFSAGLHEGVSEREITRQVDDALTAAGSEPPPFPFTLLLGERTALPHGETGESRLRPGDVAFVEMSGVCQGYCAGLVRTALLGRNPAAEDLYRIAQEAQQAAIDALRPGATTGEVDAACRGVVERAGRGETFRHRTGYSIGLDWQDRGNTSLKPGGQDIIQPGMTFHMPTNLFERGQFGVGCSETVLVTPTGNEVLSGLPRELIRVPERH